MTEPAPACDLSGVSVIIPALNEERGLARLLPILNGLSVGHVIVADNGSTDQTRAIAEAHGATWVFEPTRGYGAACYAGMQHLASDSSVVVFIDADMSDDPALLPVLASPILNDECDFVVSARVPHLRESDAMTLAQRFANRLFPWLMRLGWGYRYTDMGPFRAIRRSSLDAIGMRDRAFGWTIEMQIRAVELGLRIREVPVPYRRRAGQSKISGSVRGVFLAAYWISRTCVTLWWTRRRRLAAS